MKKGQDSEEFENGNIFAAAYQLQHLMKNKRASSGENEALYKLTNYKPDTNILILLLYQRKRLLNITITIKKLIHCSNGNKSRQLLVVMFLLIPTKLSRGTKAKLNNQNIKAQTTGWFKSYRLQIISL